MKILGIETSCDETAAAVVANGREILSSVVATQIELHAPFGGVVPELASRAHAERITAVIRAALDEAATRLEDLDAIAVTTGPGLVGALLVGLSAAKGIAWSRGLPLVPVDHIEGHVHSALMEHPDLPFPHVALVASGGHTRLHRVDAPGRIEILGSTRDDAAGEAFDKVAALLGLGYPGGPVIERTARAGNPDRFAFPRTRLEPGSLDFSFSGIKTAVLYQVLGQDARKGAGALPADAPVPDLAASFQEAVVDVLVEKTLEAARRVGAGAVAIAGGVASNGRLRARLAEAAGRLGIRAVVPRPEMCTDNAAMIAGLGTLRFEAGRTAGLDVEVAA